MPFFSFFGWLAPARAALFLASDGSDWIIGVMLPVGGGLVVVVSPNISSKH